MSDATDAVEAAEELELEKLRLARAKGLALDLYEKLAQGKTPNGDIERIRDACAQLPVTPRTFREACGVPSLTAPELMILRDQLIDYVIEPLAIRGCLTHLHGPPKGGKSVFALHLAVCASWGNFPGEDAPITIPKPMRIVYLTWEDSAPLLARRICNYSAGLGLGFTIPENLTVLDCPDLTLSDEEHVKLLETEINEKQYDLVILDTFSHAHDANEDKAFEIKPVMRRLKKIARNAKCSILYVHHRRKDGESVSMSERARGSTAISAAADIIIDWGDRRGSHTTPVEFTSKWGVAGNWKVDYDVREDGAVTWAVHPQGSKREQTGKQIESLIATIRELTKTEKPLGPDIVRCRLDQGVSKRATYYHLSKAVEQGKLRAIESKNGTFYEVI